MEYVLGIDLGTTNSCVFYQDENGGFKAIPFDNSHLIPSVVSFKDGKFLVGKQADNQKIVQPTETVYAFKRLIGRRWESQFLQNAINHYSYKIVKTEDNSIRILINGEKYAIEEISAMLLSKIKKESSKYLGKKIEKAVITVPAYFNENQRKSTKDAGAIAGLDVIRIINEPTAAALAYGFRQGKNQHILVYDLGGGTFDVTILEINDDIFEVVATAGDTFLGGEDFTNTIVEWIEQDIIERYEKYFTIKSDPIIHQRIKDAAEKAKKELSARSSVTIDLPFLFIDTNKNTINYTSTLSKEQIESMVMPLVDRTIEVVEKTLEHLEMDISEVEQILLVGGQTRMPLIKSKLGEFFNTTISKGINPDEAVSLGAAIQGSLLTSNENQSVLLDVISQSMGIMVSGGYYEKIIEKGSIIPCSAEKIFTTIKDNQEVVEINIFQGENWKADDNTYLGTIKITDIPPLPQGNFRVNVKFIVTSEGILKVEATDLQTNKTHNLVIEGTSGLSPDQIEKLKTRCELSYEKGEFRKKILEKIDTVRKLIPEAREILDSVNSPTDKVDQYEVYIDRLESIQDMTEDAFNGYQETLKTIEDALSKLIG